MTGKREQLIETAIELFAEHGFHATGIDLIAERARVTKKTMYSHFRSKEELIVAALREHDGRFREHFVTQVEAASRTPRGRLLAVFDVAEAWFADERFHGCMFINAIGEYSAAESAIRAVCREFKQLMTGYLEALAREAGLRDPAGVAKTLALLLEGAIVTAQVAGDAGAARTAKRAAKVIVDAAA